MIELLDTALPGVFLVQGKVFRDERGWFSETFSDRAWRQAFEKRGLAAPGPFVQDNASCSRRCVVRGLHFQLPPHGQGKLVRVAHGRAFDVCVDVRRGSPTFGRWIGTQLSAENQRQLWIPAGFAHGFMSQEEGTMLCYKTTSGYEPKSERSVRWDDPSIGIRWPADEAGEVASLSAKDQEAPLLEMAELPDFRVNNGACSGSGSIQAAG